VDKEIDQVDRTVPDALDREAGIIRSAILMVGSGESDRVVLTGLRLSEQLAQTADPMAEAAGVRIVRLWTTDEGGYDLAVERVPS